MSFGGAVQSDIDPDATGDIDDFSNRTIALHDIPGSTDADEQGAWGETSSGSTWRATFWNFGAPFGVSGGVGQWRGPFLDGGGFADWGVQLIDWDVGQYWYPAVIAGEGSLYVRFRFNTVGVSFLSHLDNTEPQLTHFNGTANEQWQINIIATQGSPSDLQPGQIRMGFDVFYKTDWIANAWYTLEVKQSGSTVQARVWADEIEAVPAFMVSGTVSPAFPWGHDVNDGGDLDWFASGGLSASGTWTMDTDRIWFVPVDGGGGGADDFESIATGWGP